MSKRMFVLMIISCIAAPLSAYQIAIKNELDGPLSVNITEGKVTTPRSVRPGEYFSYYTSGCYDMNFTVASGRAVGQGGGVGNAITKACKDYKIITRFVLTPTFNPVTQKEDLPQTIMEIREE